MRKPSMSSKLEEVTPPEGARKQIADRSLLSDFWRVCLGVLLGLLAGLAIAFLLRPPHILIVFGAIVAGPTLFVGLLLIARRRTRWLALARTVGTVAGLLAFMVLILDEGFTRPIDSLRSAGPILAIYGAVAFTLITVGFVTSNLVWSRLYTHQGR